MPKPEGSSDDSLAIYALLCKQMTCLCFSKSKFLNPEQQLVYSGRLISTLHGLAENKLTVDDTITVLAVFAADNYMVCKILNVVL